MSHHYADEAFTCQVRPEATEKVDPTRIRPYNAGHGKKTAVRYSRLFIPTLRDRPRGVRSRAHELLVRGGYVRSIGQGLFSFLPLGLRVARNVERLLREQMDLLGGLEVSVPVVSPSEVWKKSGRFETVGRDMVVFPDRVGRTLVLSPTHEEAVIELVRDGIKSYRDLPAFFYQIQTKFRDEARPRYGLVRAREFVMKDGYSFHRTFADLNNFFPKVFSAYAQFFGRCDLDVIPAEAGVGYIGGDKAYEFLVSSDLGEDTVIVCDACGYAANGDVARGATETCPAKLLPIAEVTTPGCHGTARVSDFLGIPRSVIAKTLVFRAARGYVMAVVRGDHEISEEKLSRVIGSPVLGPADRDALSSLGLIPEYLSPIGLDSDVVGLDLNMIIVLDRIVADTPNLVFAGNETDLHYINVNIGRDFEVETVADIARVKGGRSCSQCGGLLREQKALELGHIFRLGDRFSRSMELFVHTDTGERLYPYMGAYGIGIGRVIAAVVDSHNDPDGIIWPAELAPYRCYLMAIGPSAAANRIAESLADELGDDVLFDDRRESISTKFKDSDMVGCPYRIVVTGETSTTGEIELYDRRTRLTRRVARDDVRGQVGLAQSRGEKNAV